MHFFTLNFWKRITVLSLLVFICGSFFWWNRPFPKRLLGNYTGIQEAYEVQFNDQKAVVPESDIRIKLAYDQLLIQTPLQTKKVSYTVKDKTRNYYNLEVEIENKRVENWRLFRKGKKIVRPPLAPHPETIFLKR